MSNGQERQRAAELERQRYADQRLEDTRLTEDTGESVLDSGRLTPSYAFREPPPPEPIAGGGLVETPQMGLLRERAEEERMRRTSEQFVGSTTEEEEAQQERGPSPGKGAAAPTDIPSEEKKVEEEEHDEFDRAAQLKQQVLLAERARAERAAAAAHIEQRSLDRNTHAYDTAKIGSIATIFGPPFIIAYQTIRENFFPSRRIPKARFSEKIGCFFFFFSMLFGWLIAPPFFIGPVFLLIVGAVLILRKLGGF